jgi:hypothetical protein
MPSSFRRLGATALLLLSGACAYTRQSPEEGWPAELDFSRIRGGPWSAPATSLLLPTRGPGAGPAAAHRGKRR